jgi:hypothetical protein
MLPSPWALHLTTSVACIVIRTLLRPTNARICREERTTDPAADREPVVSDLACYGQLSPECQFPGCDSMTRGNGLPSLYSAGGAAFGLKRRRRHAALPSRGISPAVRRARASAETRGRGPSGSDGKPAPGRWQSAHLFGQLPGPGLRAAPLPSPEHTHLPARLTIADPATSPVSAPKMANPPARPPGNPHTRQEIKAGHQRIITSRTAARENFRPICNQDIIPLAFALIRGLGPAMLPVTRIVRC